MRPINNLEPLGNHVLTLTDSSLASESLSWHSHFAQVQDEGVIDHRDETFSVGFPEWAAGISQET